MKNVEFKTCTKLEFCTVVSLIVKHENDVENQNG